MQINLVKIAQNAGPLIKHTKLDINEIAHFLIHYHLKEFKPEDYREFSMWGISEATLIEDLTTLLKTEVQK